MIHRNTLHPIFTTDSPTETALLSGPWRSTQPCLQYISQARMCRWLFS